MKIRKRKKEKPAKKLDADVPKADESLPAYDPKERMDFGGLPDRDLKKNLGGCG